MLNRYIHKFLMTGSRTKHTTTSYDTREEKLSDDVRTTRKEKRVSNDAVLQQGPAYIRTERKSQVTERGRRVENRKNGCNETERKSRIHAQTKMNNDVISLIAKDLFSSSKNEK